jgi:hypothetical protein
LITDARKEVSIVQKSKPGALLCARDVLPPPQPSAHREHDVDNNHSPFFRAEMVSELKLGRKTHNLSPAPCGMHHIVTASDMLSSQGRSFGFDAVSLGLSTQKC